MGNTLKNTQCIIVYGHSLDKVDYDSLKYIINKCFENYKKAQTNRLENPIETTERKLWKENFEIYIFYHSKESLNRVTINIRNILGNNFEELNINGRIHYCPDCEDASK